MKRPRRFSLLLHIILLSFSLVISYYLAHFWRDILLARYQKLHPPGGNPQEGRQVSAPAAEVLQHRIDEALQQSIAPEEKSVGKIHNENFEKEG